MHQGNGSVSVQVVPSVAVLVTVLVGLAAAHSPHDVVGALGVAPSQNGHTVFAAVRGKMLRSVNGGHSWHRMMRDTSLPSGTRGWIEVSQTYDVDETTFHTDRGQVYRSTDGGYNYASLSLQGDFKACPERGALVMSPQFAVDRNVFVAMMSQNQFSVHRSSDGGDSFTELSLGVELNACATLHMADDGTVFVGTAAGELLASLNNGLTWGTTTVLASWGQARSITRVLSAGGGAAPCADRRSLLLLSDRVGEGSEIIQVTVSAATAELVKIPLFWQLPLRLNNAKLHNIGLHERPGGSSTIFLFPDTDGDPDTRLFVTFDGGMTITAQNRPDGLRATARNDHDDHHKFHCHAYYSSASVRGTDTVYLGTYRGVYFSKNGGESWAYLNTINSELTSIDVMLPAEGGVQLNLCTYVAGCFALRADLDALQATPQLQSVPQENVTAIPKLRPGYIQQRYNGIVSSPTAGMTGLAFRADHGLFQSSTDGFNTVQNIQKEHLALIDRRPRWSSHSSTMVHDITFSNNFATDGTMFVCGHNLGVIVSYDYGGTFTTLWNSTTAEEFGHVMDMHASPDYATDGTIAVRIDMYDETRAPGSFGFGCKSHVYVTRDFGATWRRWTHQDGACINQIAVPTGGANLRVVANVHPSTPWGTFRDRSELCILNAWGQLSPVWLASWRARPLGHPGSSVVAGPTGLIFVAYRGGSGSAVIDLQRRRRQLSWSGQLSNSSRTPAWGIGYPVRKNWLRSQFKSAAFSPNFASDSTIFAVSFYEVIASFDGGKLWRVIYELPFGNDAVMNQTWV